MRWDAERRAPLGINEQLRSQQDHEKGDGRQLTRVFLAPHPKQHRSSRDCERSRSHSVLRDKQDHWRGTVMLSGKPERSSCDHESRGQWQAPDKAFGLTVGTYELCDCRTDEQDPSGCCGCSAAKRGQT